MPALAREAADRMGALLLPGKGIQTATSTATTQIVESPARAVELRGLEPLTPTLPGRHDRVCGGSPQINKRGDHHKKTGAPGHETPRTRPTATTNTITRALGRRRP